MYPIQIFLLLLLCSVVSAQAALLPRSAASTFAWSQDRNHIAFVAIDGDDEFVVSFDIQKKLISRGPILEKGHHVANIGWGSKHLYVVSSASIDEMDILYADGKVIDRRRNILDLIPETNHSPLTYTYMAAEEATPPWYRRIWSSLSGKNEAPPKVLGMNDSPPRWVRAGQSIFGPYRDVSAVQVRDDQSAGTAFVASDFGSKTTEACIWIDGIRHECKSWLHDLRMGKHWGSYAATWGCPDPGGCQALISGSYEKVSVEPTPKLPAKLEHEEFQFRAERGRVVAIYQGHEIAQHEAIAGLGFPRKYRLSQLGEASFLVPIYNQTGPLLYRHIQAFVQGTVGDEDEQIILADGIEIFRTTHSFRAAFRPVVLGDYDFIYLILDQHAGDSCPIVYNVFRFAKGAHTMRSTGNCNSYDELRFDGKQLRLSFPPRTKLSGGVEKRLQFKM